MSSGNLDSFGHTLLSNSSKNKKSLAKFNVLQSLLECTCYKLQIFSKLIINQNFYSISNKDMPSGNLDSFGHI